jgi:site-specific DNA-methyltransferase (adenine-specific)
MGGGWNGGKLPRPEGGRWPTNVVLSHAGNDVDGDLCADGCVPSCPVAELDAQSGTLSSGGRQWAEGDTNTASWRRLEGRTDVNTRGAYDRPGDTGGASRYFPVFRYEAKADSGQRPKVAGAAHPTVKPLGLMRWLVRLVTPAGGLVLDQFAGTGTTAEACVIEGFRCVTVEREAAYLPLIAARLSKPLQPVLFAGEG